MRWIYAGTALVAAALSLPVACTNFDLEMHNKRVSENFSGEITAPGDLDPAGTNNFTFIIMGDTHIGSPGGEVMRRIVEAGVAAGDAFAVIAGDVTQGGLDGEFAQFKTVFSNNSLPFRAAIGNHDLYFGGWERFRQQLGRSIYSFNADNVHFVMIDSGNGILGKRQLQWLEDDLRVNTRPHVVIVTHFPPWNGHFSSIYKMSSEEEAAVLKDIAFRHGVDIIAAGHYHGFAEKDIGRTKYIVTGGANDLIDLGQRMNYVRVRVAGDAMTIEVVYP
ncbi:MAG TPA: metallophosphoesterase [Bdellovibrionales bacterium]|nr:metallophosphoesterase [Bdellovibrionales bacterium]